jgi:hypothetical protein
MPKKKRKYNTNLIKETLSYSTYDISELYRIHKGTVRQWLKEGLPMIDNRKPYLVFGSDLKEFIKKRQGSRKTKCNSNELYCCKCRKPQSSWNNVVDLKILNERRLLIMGICGQCNTLTNKLSSLKNLDEIKEIFDVQTIHDQDLIGFDPSIVNTNINEELST